jgi:hypothetical protein
VGGTSRKRAHFLGYVDACAAVTSQPPRNSVRRLYIGMAGVLYVSISHQLTTLADGKRKRMSFYLYVSTNLLFTRKPTTFAIPCASLPKAFIVGFT